MSNGEQFYNIDTRPVNHCCFCAFFIRLASFWTCALKLCLQVSLQNLFFLRPTNVFPQVGFAQVFSSVFRMAANAAPGVVFFFDWLVSVIG